MRRSPLLLAPVLALALSACAGDAEVDVDTSPDVTATGTATGTAFTDCEAERYAVGYPQDWNVNEPDEHTPACTIFHPGEIDTPDQPRDRDLHWAVTVYVDAVGYEDVADRDARNEEISREEITVEGRDAVVGEYRSTGAALVPEGERWYSYTVDLDGEILVAVTYTVGDTDYERDKEILDRMVTEELSIPG